VLAHRARAARFPAASPTKRALVQAVLDAVPAPRPLTPPAMPRPNQSSPKAAVILELVGLALFIVARTTRRGEMGHRPALRRDRRGS